VPRWLPNALCFLRIALIPAWMAHAFWCAEAVQAGESGAGHRTVAILALLAIGVTDVLDGWIARRYHLETKFGESLDAFADKLAQVALLLFLAFEWGDAFVQVPIALVALVIAGDLVLVTGSLVIRSRLGAVAVAHAYHGKLASFLLFLLLLAVTSGAPASWLAPAWWIVGAVIALSTLAYVRHGWRQWKAGTR
jgi:phosphatidylglycerophosphate synthase